MLHLFADNSKNFIPGTLGINRNYGGRLTRYENVIVRVALIDVSERKITQMEKLAGL